MSYQSLEDRIVKRAIAPLTVSTTPLDLPVDLPGHDPEFAWLTRGRRNPRTRTRSRQTPGPRPRGCGRRSASGRQHRDHRQSTTTRGRHPGEPGTAGGADRRTTGRPAARPPPRPGGRTNVASAGRRRSPASRLVAPGKPVASALNRAPFVVVLIALLGRRHRRRAVPEHDDRRGRHANLDREEPRHRPAADDRGAATGRRPAGRHAANRRRGRRAGHGAGRGLGDADRRRGRRRFGGRRAVGGARLRRRRPVPRRCTRTVRRQPRPQPRLRPQRASRRSQPTSRRAPAPARPRAQRRSTAAPQHRSRRAAAPPAPAPSSAAPSDPQPPASAASPTAAQGAQRQDRSGSVAGSARSVAPVDRSPPPAGPPVSPTGDRPGRPRPAARRHGDASTRRSCRVHRRSPGPASPRTAPPPRAPRPAAPRPAAQRPVRPAPRPVAKRQGVGARPPGQAGNRAAVGNPRRRSTVRAGRAADDAGRRRRQAGHDPGHRHRRLRRQERGAAHPDDHPARPARLHHRPQRHRAGLHRRGPGRRGPAGAVHRRRPAPSGRSDPGHRRRRGPDRRRGDGQADLRQDLRLPGPQPDAGAGGRGDGEDHPTVRHATSSTRSSPNGRTCASIRTAPRPRRWSAAPTTTGTDCPASRPSSTPSWPARTASGWSTSTPGT